jgi:uncharacterized protein YcsI (UPF0317 family)
MTFSGKSPVEVRELFSNNKLCEATCGMCDDYVQANVVILAADCAHKFRLFCELNPRAAPILEVLSPAGNPFTSKIAHHADIRYCLPKYRIYTKDKNKNKNGAIVFEEVSDIAHLWSDDFVTFLLGCSFSFEHRLIRHGIQLKHIQMNRNVTMFKTNINTNNDGLFTGDSDSASKLVVSMRPIQKHLIEKVYQITQPFECAHSSPISFSRNGRSLGIRHICKPDYGDSVGQIADDEFAVFWACGITTHCAIELALKS